MPAARLIEPTYDPAITGEAVRALLDGQPRLLTPDDGDPITGVIMDVYRSVMTGNIRLRIASGTGRTSHVDTHNVQTLDAA